MSLTTISNKINLNAYSAVGDGVTDDTSIIQNAINQVGVFGGTVLFPQGTYLISKNIIFPSNITLELANGAMLCPNNGVTVTINGEIKAGFYQIFSGAGTISPNSNPKNDEVYPQWWGLAGNGITDDSSAFQKAFDFVANNLKTIKVPKGKYLWATTISVPSTFILIGNNHGSISASPYQYNTFECNIHCKANPVFQGIIPGTPSAPFDCTATIEDLAFYADYITSDITFFQYFSLRSSTIRNTLFQNFDYFLYGRCYQITRIENNFFENVHNAVIYTSVLSKGCTDSYIRNNYMHGDTFHTNVKLLNFSYLTDTAIIDNFMDYCYTAVYIAGGDNITIRDNIFNYCFIGIYSEGQAHISDNTFSNGTKDCPYYWGVVSPPEMYSSDYVGVKLGLAANGIDLVNNHGFNQDVLFDITSHRYCNIKSSGTNTQALNSTGVNGKVFNLAMDSISDGSDPNDLINIDLPELNKVGYYSAKNYLVGDGSKDDYFKFNRLVANIGPSPSTIYFPPGFYRIHGNVTIPSNIKVKFARGAYLAPDTGKTITINGYIESDNQQIFTSMAKHIGNSGGFGTGLTVNYTTSTVNGTSGVVTSVTINNGGSGYSVGTVLYIGCDNIWTYASGFAKIVVTSVNVGIVTAISLLNGGVGYSTSGTGAYTFGTAKFGYSINGGAISSVFIANGGEGYLIGNVLELKAGTNDGNPSTGSGSGSLATVTSVTPTTVFAVSITNPGTGYSNMQGVSVTGGSGTGCKVSLLTDSGAIIAVSISAGGSGYKIGDLLTVPGGSNGILIVTQTKGGAITGVTLTAGGAGYSMGTITGTPANDEIKQIWYSSGLIAPLNGSVSFNPDPIPAGSQIITNITAAGAVPGDFVMSSFGLDLAGLQLTAYVSAADTVTCIFANHTSSAIDLGSSTLRVRVIKQQII